MNRKLLLLRLIHSTHKNKGKLLEEKLGQLRPQRTPEAVERPPINVYPFLGGLFGVFLSLETAHKYWDFKILVLREKLEGAKAKLEQFKEEMEAKKRPETSL